MCRLMTRFRENKRLVWAHFIVFGLFRPLNNMTCYILCRALKVICWQSEVFDSIAFVCEGAGVTPTCVAGEGNQNEGGREKEPPSSGALCARLSPFPPPSSRIRSSRASGAGFSPFPPLRPPATQASVTPLGGGLGACSSRFWKKGSG